MSSLPRLWANAPAERTKTIPTAITFRIKFVMILKSPHGYFSAHGREKSCADRESSNMGAKVDYTLVVSFTSAVYRKSSILRTVSSDFAPYRAGREENPG